MPTLLSIFGLRFFFYADEHAPAHVHVDWQGKRAKVELVPEVRLVYNHGLKEPMVRKAVETCRVYREEFLEAWHRCFDE